MKQEGVSSGVCRVFCYKQKTAYEMRISDWSSDVCSSDLGLAHLLRVERSGPLEGILEDQDRGTALGGLVRNRLVLRVDLLEVGLVLRRRPEIRILVAQRLRPLGRAEDAVGRLAELLDHRRRIAEGDRDMSNVAVQPGALPDRPVVRTSGG